MGGGGEAAAVADLDEDPGSGPDADSGHRDQDLGKRVGLQQFLDPPGQELALVEDGGERAGQARDDQSGRFGAGNHHGLLVQRGEYVLDQPLGHPRRFRPQQRDQPPAACLSDLGRGTEPLQHGQDSRVLQPRAQDPFQGRVDLGEQAVEPVHDAGGLTGQVVVEADDHLQLGDRLIFEVDRAQRVRHRAGGVGDDERVPRVGLGLARVEVGDPPHRQAGQVGDGAAHVPGDRQGQGADRGRLVDYDQHRSVLGLEFREQLAELGLGVGQAFVERLLPGRCDGGGVVFALTDVQAEIDVDVAGLDHVHPPVVLLPGLVHGTDRHIHITKSLPTYEQAGGHAPNQRSVSASGPGDTTPRIMVNKGGKSCRARRPVAPLRGHQKGNGGGTPRRCWRTWSRPPLSTTSWSWPGCARCWTWRPSRVRSARGVGR